MTEKQMREIVAAAVAEALARASAPARGKGKGKAKAKASAPVRGSAWVSEREVHRGEYKFVFTLVQAGIRNGAYDKYSVAITRTTDGATIEARPRVAAGMSLRERYTTGALDALVGYRTKKFAAVA
jgi:hypothetical protein